MSDWPCWGVVKMELEVSYDEICCEDGQAERRRGAPGCINGGGEAVGTDCVDVPSKSVMEGFGNGFWGLASKFILQESHQI